MIGGGMVGMETAEYLAEKGAKVSVLEMLPDICSDMGTTRKICMGEEIQKSGIIPVTSVKVTEIGDNVVIGEKDGEKVEFPCDAAVLAIGAKKRDGSALAETCYKNGIGYFEIGDAAMARRAINATREAMDAALTFDREDVHRDVSKPKKLVFITGASGMMGGQTLKQLLARPNRFKVRALLRPSDKNRVFAKETYVSCT